MVTLLEGGAAAAALGVNLVSSTALLMASSAGMAGASVNNISNSSTSTASPTTRPLSNTTNSAGQAVGTPLKDSRKPSLTTGIERRFKLVLTGETPSSARTQLLYAHTKVFLLASPFSEEFLTGHLILAQ